MAHSHFFRLTAVLLVLVLRQGEAAALPGNWTPIGRTKIETNANAFVIQGGFVKERQTLGDMEFSFLAQAAAGAREVQLWAGFRCQNRDSRYVFALRGGNDNDLYLARYAPHGNAKFLGFAPLDFKPVPGVSYRLRVAAVGKRIQIFLNDEKLPRINVVDNDALWTNGSVCLGGGWLPAEFFNWQARALTNEEKAAFLALGDQVWTAPAVDKESLRKKQRAQYEPAESGALGPYRTEIDLDGDWLLMPDYQLAAGDTPVGTNYNDQAWHVMRVPEFWTPGLSWLHGETGFPELTGVARTKGVAESLYVQETRRADAYTFDWHKTKAAWYRHYLDLPADLQGRHFILTFDAIAKVSEIWVNGAKVGAHTGLFGEIKCDVTAAIVPGRNVIAAHVTSAVESPASASGKVEGVAVTVEVTSKMLHSLPHGMLQDDVGGIWQPVTLTATAPVRVTDCFVQPNLHGAGIELEIANAESEPAKLSIDYTITFGSNNAPFFNSPREKLLKVSPGHSGHVRLATPYLNPKLWTPAEPNLYNLEVRLRKEGKIVDKYTTRFGFRTFARSGSELLLNGRPYWLRGGNPFPNTLRPNDGELAHGFTQWAHDGNVRVTRSHIVPFTETWLDAADEVGMGVSFEGTWPWLMLRGEPPERNLLDVWKEENLSLMRKYRNHPSLLFWTVNNEMKFESMDATNRIMLRDKWVILDNMIEAMRKVDPTRPIVADSSYVRKESRKGFQSVVTPNHFDDGDIDDGHRYYGWYNETFFHFFDGQYGRQYHTQARPLISQEMATGYPNEDDGHPTRFYLFKHQTPQSFVGDDAYENADPALFLTRQAFLTKELAETFRRSSRDTMAGILHFAYFTWFIQPWSMDTLRPGPGYYALKTALQPVLVSAELYGRHVYAGSTLHCRICVANDSDNGMALPPTELAWQLAGNPELLAEGRLEIPPVKYYQNHWIDVAIPIPDHLPTPRLNGKLNLVLQAEDKNSIANGEHKIISENSYDLVIATPAWANAEMEANSQIDFIGSRMKNEKILGDLPVNHIAAVDAARMSDLLIIGDAGELCSRPEEAKKLRKFVADGGRVLLLHPGGALTNLYPKQIKKFTGKQGEIVTMHVPESPMFSGIEPLDLAWFERGKKQIPIACTGVYQLNAARKDVTALASQLDIHGYLQKPADLEKYEGAPLVEIRQGKGRLLASELSYESGDNDPIARRLLRNAIEYLEKPKQ